MSASFLNLRTAPATTSTILVIVPPSVALNVRGEAQAGFVPVVYGENSGWVDTDLIEFSQPPTPTSMSDFDESQLLPEGLATLAESLNLRAGPGPDFDLVQVVEAGTRVEATGEVQGLYEKISFDGKEGWVRSIYVDRGPELEGDALRTAHVVAAITAAGQTMVAPGIHMVTDAEIVLRAEPSLSGRKLTVVPVRSRLTLTGKRNGEFLEAEFGGKTGWVAGEYLRRLQPPAASPPQVPVLMYHSIQQKGAEYQVTATQLEEQLQWLSRNGYESITSAELLAWMTYGVPLPEKPIVISIDDGNASDWVFLELLDRYGFEGVFALPNYAELSPREIRTLDRAGEVCGHTVSHQNLSTLSYNERVHQIVENKNYLEKILDNSVTCFAYPLGTCRGLTPYVVIEAGYLLAFDVSGGLQPLDSTIDRWHISRINVSGNGTLDDFIASLQG